MKTRIIHTKFWKDDYIVSLPRHEKLLFLYLLTNDAVSITGIYELPERYIMADLEITAKELASAKSKFQNDGKIIFYKNWVKIVNAEKYNSFNGEKLEKAREKELALIPRELIEYRYSIDTSIHTSIDTLNNHNHKDLKEKRGMGEKETFPIQWLEAMTDEEATEMAQTFNTTTEYVKSVAAKIVDYCASTGKRYKDHKATLRNWLRNDKEKPLPGQLKMKGIINLDEMDL